MLEKARLAHPLEACALLFGRKEGEQVIVEDVVPVENRNESPTSFSVDAELFYKIYKRMESEGKDYVGIFHSHPAPAYPSAVDEEAMRFWPDLVWLIYSTSQRGLQAFVFDGADVRRLELVIS